MYIILIQKEIGLFHNNIDNDNKEKALVIQELVDNFNEQFSQLHKTV
jgi:hypothetical protein